MAGGKVEGSADELVPRFLVDFLQDLAENPATSRHSVIVVCTATYLDGIFRVPVSKISAW